jgi:hypothetical protein
VGLSQLGACGIRLLSQIKHLLFLTGEQRAILVLSHCICSEIGCEGFITVCDGVHAVLVVLLGFPLLNSTANLALLHTARSERCNKYKYSAAELKLGDRTCFLKWGPPFYLS